MCAINFDNFRTDPRELLSGKHKTPTSKRKGKQRAHQLRYREASWAGQENCWGQFYKTEYKNALKATSYLPIMSGLLSVEGQA